MVKCTCGRIFKNMGKMHRHFKIWESDPRHVLDTEYATAMKDSKRYNKSHKKGRG